MFGIEKIVAVSWGTSRFHPLADFFHIELIVLQFKYCLFILYLVRFTSHFDFISVLSGIRYVLSLPFLFYFCFELFRLV